MFSKAWSWYHCCKGIRSDRATIRRHMKERLPVSVEIPRAAHGREAGWAKGGLL